MSSVAAHIEIEQMIRWLCEHANHFTISTFNGGVSIYASWMGSDKDGCALRLGTGPTLHEALAGAVEYMRREYGK